MKVHFINKPKIMQKTSKVVVMMACAIAVMVSLTGCQEDNTSMQQKQENKSGVGQMQTIVKSVYKTRNHLEDNWAKRDSIKLKREYFENDYIYRYVTFYLYESIRYLNPEHARTQSIQINRQDIKKVDGLLFVPVDVFDITENGKHDKYRQFFVFQAKDTENPVIVNFISGVFADESEAHKDIKIFGKDDWNKSVYSKMGRESLSARGVTGSFANDYVEFIQGDQSKDEFLKEREHKEVKMESKSKYSQKRKSYNRGAAVAYAKRYSSKHDVWSTKSYNDAYRSFNLDCANFVSQCLYAGGFRNRGNNKKSCASWYYWDMGTSHTNDDKYSQTWSTANGLKRYLYDCGRFTSVVYPDDLWSGRKIKIGDPFFFDKTYPGYGEAPIYNHSMIVTKIRNGNVFYSAHTANRKDRIMHTRSTGYDFWFTKRWTRGFHITHLNG